MFPSVASCTIRSLALACSPDTTPRLAILSSLERRGLAPNSSYEFGLGLSTGARSIRLALNLPRGIYDGELADADANEVIEVKPVRSNCDGVLNGLGVSNDTARENGMGAGGCESLLSAPPSSGPLRLGTHIPLLPFHVLFLRATRHGLGPIPRDEESRLESRRKVVLGSLGLQAHQQYAAHGA